MRWELLRGNLTEMSKVKNAELEERALDVASLLLDHIEFELKKDMPDTFKLKAFSKVYQILKPYF